MPRQSLARRSCSRKSACGASFPREDITRRIMAMVLLHTFDASHSAFMRVVQKGKGRVVYIATSRLIKAWLDWGFLLFRGSWYYKVDGFIMLALELKQKSLKISISFYRFIRTFKNERIPPHLVHLYPRSLWTPPSNIEKVLSPPLLSDFPG